MKAILLFLLLPFIVLSTAHSYDMPIGIPNPGFGLDEVKPSRPDPWTSEQVGFYYVEDTVGCSTSLTYGFPGSPRCYIPEVPAGSYVEIHGNYAHKVAGVIKLKGAGTVDSPVWFVGESDSVRPTLLDVTFIQGSYVYLEHLNFHFTGDNDMLRIGSNSSRGFEADHVMVRNCTMTGDGLTRTGGFAVAGYYKEEPEEPSEYIIAVNNLMYNHGSLDAAIDLDAHAIRVNKRARYLWLLDNTIHTTGGSGFAIGQEGPTWHYDDIEYVYAGRNHVYNTTQAALAIKGAHHVVFSENIAHDQITRWKDGIVGGDVSSPSKCFGWKGEPQDYWIIYNKCYNNSYGVHGGSTVTGDWNIYVIGNEFRDIYAEPGEPYTGANGWSEAAISLVGGNHVYAINNTVVDSCSGIMTPGSGANDKFYYIENNIISNVTEATGSHINSENSANETIVRNNIVHQSNGDEMIRWFSAGEYTLAEFQVATGKCQGCVSTDPMFVSTSDLRLQSGSPAKDTGLADTSLTFDVYGKFQETYGLDIRKDMMGTLKPQGTEWDIGAYEIEQPPQPPKNLRIQ